MEDKRVIKTKLNIKHTLIRMLEKTSFNKIAVTELCAAANTARITFYTYYSDKFDLVDDMMEDYFRDAYDKYHVLQERNNSEQDGIKGYENLLECILWMYDSNRDFFKHVSPETNPSLYSMFYQKIVVSVEEYLNHHTKGIVPRYPASQMAALLCGGLWAIIHRSYAMGMSKEDAHNSIRMIYQTLLQSPLFILTVEREKNDSP